MDAQARVMQKNSRLNCRSSATSFLVIQSKFFLKLLIVLLDLPSTLRQTLVVTSVSSLFCQASTCFRIGSKFPLDSIKCNRDAVDERERFRVFREHRSEHAGDNVSRFGPANIRFSKNLLPAQVDRAWLWPGTLIEEPSPLRLLFPLVLIVASRPHHVP